MKRKIYSDLLDWKNKADRRPLILLGARQVGKTYLLKLFGKTEFDRFHHLDFERNREKLSRIFQGDLSHDKILFELSLFLGRTISPENDLLIFDEVQNAPRALTSLKYFYEDLPELAICCAGSLLGIKLIDADIEKVSFPVGKVEFMNLGPMTFEEFLWASEPQQMSEVFETIWQDQTISAFVHEKLWDSLKEYYIVGGMPKVVQNYLAIKEQDKFLALNNARIDQNNIVKTYKNDFSKHSGKINAVHINTCFNNIPIQLSQYHDISSKRYTFNKSIPGKRGYPDLIGPIDWLVSAGLAIKVPIANHLDHPLKSFCKPNLFKLYIFDIGILGSMLDLSPKIIYEQNYGISKGYFAENFVATELHQTKKGAVFSWNSKNHEIEFVTYREESIIPIEVKSGRPSRSKSLEILLEKYNLNYGIILSKGNISKGEKFRQYPLYLIGRL